MDGKISYAVRSKLSLQLNTRIHNEFFLLVKTSGRETCILTDNFKLKRTKGMSSYKHAKCTDIEKLILGIKFKENKNEKWIILDASLRNIAVRNVKITSEMQLA